jgi:hypothetical protein
LLSPFCGSTVLETVAIVRSMPMLLLRPDDDDPPHPTAAMLAAAAADISAHRPNRRPAAPLKGRVSSELDLLPILPLLI